MPVMSYACYACVAIHSRIQVLSSCKDSPSLQVVQPVGPAAEQVSQDPSHPGTTQVWKIVGNVGRLHH